MAENKFSETISTLFNGVDSLITTKTVVGEAMHFDDGTVILPLVEVSFGMGAGAWSKEAGKDTAGGGLGGKMVPSAVVVIKDGQTRLVNIKNQDIATKIIDMVPNIIDSVKTGVKGKKDLKDKIDETIKNEGSNDKKDTEEEQN